MKSTLLAIFMAVAFALSGQNHPGRQDVAPSGTLPIVYINTVDNTVIDQKETYIDATLWIDASMSDEYASLGDAQNPIKLGIRGRGNSSWVSFDKKPYKIKFDKKQSVLGMPKSKHYALLSKPNGIYVADAIGYKFGEMLMSEWNPRYRMVEVVLNGYNIGLYWLCETIRIEETRVNIYEQPDMNEDMATIGSWIMEIDNYEEEETFTINTASPRHHIVYFTPKAPEKMSAMQKEWVKSEMEAIDKAINNPDPYSTEWMQHIDLESAASYVAAQEIVGNLDGFMGSTYLWRDLDTKWHFGPLWDIEWNFQAADGKGWLWEQRNASDGAQARWLPEWMHSRHLQMALERKFALAASRLDEVIDFAEKFQTMTKAAHAINAVIWPQYNDSDFDRHWSTYIRPRLEKRMAWLQSPDLFDSLNSGIEDIVDDTSHIVKSEYFTPAGQKVSTPASNGLYIRRDVMSDGTVKYTKISK